MKELLILERSQSNLDLKQDADGSIFLEGIFTEIGVENDNKRIYEEKEILPHIKELQDFVKKQKLLGELDHPKDFDISLANVSHVIEELNYDPSKKQVIGKIRLLNTSKGKEAQALVQDGIPLHISSRAAGSVRENGTVKINKMFTYDLVARPGFANAELNRVNESYGFSNNDSLFIYEMKTETQMPIIEKTKNNNYKNMDTSNFISKEDFQKYSEYLNGELNKIKESANQNSNPEVIQKIISYTDHIAEKVNQLTDFSDYLSENVNKGINYSEYIAENLNLIKDFSNYIAKELNNSISYSEHVAEMADNGLQFSNYLAGKLDTSIQYSENLAETLDSSIQYSENLAENLNTSIEYSEHIAEKVDQNISYSNYVAENVDQNISYSNYIAESLNGTDSDDTVNNYKESITEKLNGVIESAKNAKIGKEYGFLNFLNEERKNKFNSLSREKQSLIVENMNKGIVMGNLQANRIFDGFVNEKKTKLNPFNNMPEKFKRKWEILSEGRKREIVAEANLFPTLDTPYKIMNFWQTRDLRDSQVKMKSLNENKIAASEEVKNINESFITEDAKQALINKVKFNLRR